MSAFQEGRDAHASRKRRTANPYVTLARWWDEGWVSRQEENLRASGNTRRLTRFKEFVGSHI